MNVLSLLVVGVLAGQVPPSKPAAEAPPFIARVVADAGTNAIQFDCTPPFIDEAGALAVDCTMYSVHLKLELAPEELPGHLQAIRDDLKNDSDADVSELITRMCTATTAKPDAIAAAFSKDGAAALAEMCVKRTRPSLLKLAETMAVRETRTCVVHTMLPDVQRFIRSGPYRWVWNPGPRGTCQATTVGVLTSSDGSRWDYTQTRLDADQTSDLCKALELNKPHTWTSQIEPSALKCDVLRFQ